MTDNELIAEFFGFEFSRRPDSFDADKFNENWICKGNPFNGYIDNGTRYWYTKEQLLFHTSWDWLMPVVEKIKNIKASEHPSFTSVNWRRQVIDMPISSELESVYSKVVQFIKFYVGQ